MASARGSLLAIVAAILASGCAPDVRVADGQTFIMGDTHYRLWAIKAPQLGLDCADGWQAGEAAKRALIALVSHRHLVCEDRGRDPYRRVLGLCRVDGEDVGAAMVSAGMAWADLPRGRDYRVVESDARDAGRGVHGHECR
jgi:endonuclease YncB( thermonuclease family)